MAEKLMPRIAVTDIGSNSVRLLVADVWDDGTIEAVHKELKVTRLARGLAYNHTLSEEAMKDTLEALAEFKRIAQEMGAERIRMFATAAVREAVNRDGFMHRVHEKTMCLIDVLSEADEARAAFAGVAGTGPHAVFDIGGASTEIAVGMDTVPFGAVSLKMGAVRASECYPLGNKADELTFEAMKQWAEYVFKEQIGDICEKAKTQPDTLYYGVGGTITTLAAMDLKLAIYDREKVHGHLLTLQTVERLGKLLKTSTLEQRRTMPGLPADRADIILGGVVILQCLMTHFDLDSIVVSDSDNLEGYLRIREKKLMKE